MIYLKKYNESTNYDQIKSNITDLLRDSVIDEDIELKVEIGDFTNSDYKYLKVASITIGNEYSTPHVNIKVDTIKDDILRTVDYLEEEGFSNFRFIFKDSRTFETKFYKDLEEFNDFSDLYVITLVIFMEKIVDDPYIYNTRRHIESIKVPIEIGDTVLGGRFKNKKMIVKKIGKNKKGDITINDKPLLKYRTIKEDVDIDYYLEHLGDDGFYIQKNNTVTPTNEKYIRIFKPTKFNQNDVPIYSYSTCKPFDFDDIEGDVLRFIDEVELKYIYIVIKLDSNLYDRLFVKPDELYNINKNLISIAIYFNNL